MRKIEENTFQGKILFMPSIDGLYEMQDMGVNIYKYLLVKAIEALCIDGENYKYKGKLKLAYRYLKENPEIARAVCRMYPEEIIYSQVASNDLELCSSLITEKKNSEIYNLDRLRFFTDSVLDNSKIVYETVDSLSKNLPSNPKYRFTYINNKLLDDIFACSLKLSVLFPRHKLTAIVSNLVKIEPYYAITLASDPDVKSAFDVFEQKDLLIEGINVYGNRYGINSSIGEDYNGKDILTNPNDEVKKLIKCIEQRKR